MCVTPAFLPHMLARGLGRAVSKAGAMAFTRCVAMETATAGAGVNAVAPSLAMLEFLSKVTPDS